MNNFKAGDRVRLLDGEFDGIPRSYNDKVGTIIQRGESNCWRVEFDVIGEYYKKKENGKVTWYCEEDQLTLVKDDKECCGACKSNATFDGIAKEIGDLVKEKNAAYGDSFKKSASIMKILYPDGVPVDKLMYALFTVRILDKLSRIANDEKYNGEDPVQDIAGYAILLQKYLRNDELS